MDFYLFIVAACIFGLLPTCFTLRLKKSIFQFKRPFILARPIQSSVIIWLLFSDLYLLIMAFYTSRSVRYEMTVTTIVLLSIMILSRYDYLKYQEGIYTEGFLIRGILFHWDLIDQCEVNHLDEKSSKCVFHIKDNQRAKQFVIPTAEVDEIIDALNNIEFKKGLKSFHV